MKGAFEKRRERLKSRKLHLSFALSPPPLPSLGTLVARNRGAAPGFVWCVISTFTATKLVQGESINGDIDYHSNHIMVQNLPDPEWALMKKIGCVIRSIAQNPLNCSIFEFQNC